MTADAVRTIAIALTAALALVTAYHQFFRFRGARLVVLDKRGSRPQKSRILKYSNLPADIRNQFPDYRDPRGFHALVKIPIANEGDRAGYVKILDVCGKSEWLDGNEPKDQVRFSYYSYLAIPSFGIGLVTILIRNLPGVAIEKTILLGIEVELGRVHPWTHKHQPIFQEYEIEVVLRPPNIEMIAAD